MLDSKQVSCPKMYECSKIKMTPMIRAFLRCSVAEAMDSICANCEEKPEVKMVRRRVQAAIAK